MPGPISTIAAVSQDFNVYGGDDWNLPILFWSDTNHTVPIDITSYIFSLDIKKVQTSTALVSLRIGTGLTITAPNQLTILAEKLPLKGGSYYYDLEVNISGTTVTYMTGNIIVTQDTTNSTGEK